MRKCFGVDVQKSESLAVGGIWILEEEEEVAGNDDGKGKLMHGFLDFPSSSHQIRVAKNLLMQKMYHLHRYEGIFIQFIVCLPPLIGMSLAVSFASSSSAAAAAQGISKWT